MLEEQNAEPKGQPANEDFDAQSNEPDPIIAEPEGQSADTPGTSEPAPPEEDTFFDPTSVPDELQPAYKNMQADYTKKMQAIREDRQKIEAYNAFNSNPMGEIQRLAQMYGMQIVQQGQATAQQPDAEWTPNSWNEVEERIAQSAYEKAKAEVTQQFAPMVNQVQEMRQHSIERELTEIDPTWQTYEDRMTDNLKAHPTLAADPAKLYRLSVPQEVLESRATQRALKKMEDKGKAAQVGASSKTPKKPGTELPDGPMSFDDAVKYAKKKLAEDGITALGG